MTLHVRTYVAASNCMFWKPLEQRILLSFCGSHFVWIEPHGMRFPRRESVWVSHRCVACGASSALSKANRCGRACYVIDTGNTSICGCVYWDKPQIPLGMLSVVPCVHLQCLQSSLFHMNPSSIEHMKWSWQGTHLMLSGCVD